MNEADIIDFVPDRVQTKLISCETRHVYKLLLSHCCDVPQPSEPRHNNDVKVFCN